MPFSSMIKEPLAGVTMIDVNEGDCYIVDLLDSENPAQDVLNRKKWKRFLIDTGSANETIRRRKTIKDALTTIPAIDLWLGKTLPRAPPLAGVVVTHSDRDHSGNAHELLQELFMLSKLRNPDIDFAPANGINKVPIYLTPTVQWTRELHPEKRKENENSQVYEKRASEFYQKKALEFFKVTGTAEEVQVVLVKQITTANRSFSYLPNLEDIGSYAIVCRFHLLKPETLDSAIKSIDSKREQGSRWIKDVFKIQTGVEKHQLVVELGLQPVAPKVGHGQRTFPEINAEIVTGPWLRTITKIPPPESCAVYTKVPYAEAFESQLINLDSRYSILLSSGVWSTSVMGCADKGYVRDFQHLVLQFLVPKDKDKIVINDSLALWSQYANRASIINLFSHNSDPLSVGKDFAPHENPGGFKMLFTGDAFELSKGIEKMDNWNEARKLTSGNTTLTQLGFTKEAEMVSSNGNIMHWLSGNETKNQKVHVDVLKVPHHGSQITTEPTLFYNVSASVYLISGSSKAHGHPRVQVLDMIINSVREKETPASVPSGYRSKKTQTPISLPSIKERKRPRLVFCSYACAPSSTKREKDLTQIIRVLCNKNTKLANIKFLVQKTENSFSRIRFGRDARYLLRVEWDVDSWKELRPEKLADEKWNTSEDPLAYPLPGTKPDWDTPI